MAALHTAGVDSLKCYLVKGEAGHIMRTKSRMAAESCRLVNRARVLNAATYPSAVPCLCKSRLLACSGVVITPNCKHGRQGLQQAWSFLESALC